jgi:C-terminal processing protease CtpA/Prc
VAVPDTAGINGVARAGGWDVRSVLRGSPAWDAGLGAGDLIVKMDGRPVQGIPDLELIQVLDNSPRGVRLEAVRGGQLLSVTLRSTPIDAISAHIAVERRGTLLIPMKVVSDSDLIPVAGSDAMVVTVGAKRRWRSYRA